jgi:hypothetical protein
MRFVLCTLPRLTGTFSGSDPSHPLSRFSDRRGLRISFTGVTAGDSIVVEMRDHLFSPLLPGVFSIALLYDPPRHGTTCASTSPHLDR